MRPPALQKGDLIGVMAPSSKTDPAVIDKAAAILKKMGFQVKIHPQTYLQDHQSAGSPQEKAAALHDLFADPDVKAIFAARGGNCAGEMLACLDYDLIKNNPKILIGFSDVTAILHAVIAKAGLTTYHGPVMTSIAKGMDEAQLRQCFNLLAGLDNNLPLYGARALQEGKAAGKMIGGNLSLITSLVGTPYLPDMNGAILFIEDCDDEISRFSRMLTQLRNAGIFDQISGLIVGDFINTLDTGPNYFGFTLEDIVRRATTDYDFPVLMNAPFGHGGDLVTYPVGAKATLNATKDQPSTLRLAP